MAPNNTEFNNVENDVGDNKKNNAATSENGEQQFDWEAPRAQGLYDPQNEHEACGVGFIVAIDGKRNHKVRMFKEKRLSE